jgi:O-antigen/teichoic acid export membrane protein
LRTSTADAATRGYGRSASLLTGAFGAAGLLAYLYFAVASHSLDPDLYGEVVVLWSVVFVVSLTLFRPTEQLLARTLAESGVEGHVLRIAAAIQLGVAITAVTIVLALRGPLSGDLLSGNTSAYPVLVAGLVGYAAVFYMRGYMAGTRRFGLYAAALVVESAVRLGCVVAYAVGVTDDPDLALIGIALGPVASLIVFPFALARRRTASVWRADGDQVRSEMTLGRGSGFAAAVLLIMFSEQVIVSSGALIVRITLDAEAAGKIFNILLVARAPLLLFQAIAASLLPHLTGLWTQGDAASLRAFHGSVRKTVLVIVALAGAAVVGLLAIGPQVMQAAFGDQFAYDRPGLVIVGVGMGFYLCAATLSQAALAQGQARRASLCWALCAATFIVVNLLPGLDRFRQVEVGFAAAGVLLLGLLYSVYRRPHPRTEDSLEPGSPRELEVRLAAADEIS